jgi:hypothetical protein
MSHDRTDNWSEAAQAATRAVLTDWSILTTPWGFVAFKHIDGAFARMADDDVMAKDYKLADRRSGVVTIFASIDDLIDAGWVVD